MAISYLWCGVLSRPKMWHGRCGGGGKGALTPDGNHNSQTRGVCGSQPH